MENSLQTNPANIQRPYFFSSKLLDPLAESLKDKYSQAKPFPHMVMDDFLPEDVLEQILEDFPNKDQLKWKNHQNALEKKLESTVEENFPDSIRMILQQFNSAPFLKFLESLTGIQGIIADPYFKGGGLHQILPGGFLKIHADFNRHNELKLDRRLNLLLFLNKNWKEEYGGHFELWDKNMTQCELKVLPKWNRCVVFSTTDYSYHGHPDPLKCPEGMSRKSLALYYYTNGRPTEEVSAAHTTIFRQRPEESKPLISYLADIKRNIQKIFRK